MPDELKEILRRELDELKQNKIRVIALAVCFILLLIFWIADDSSDGEEIALNDKLTTETAIKYIICYLGYGDIASITDTFKTDFIDEGMISPDMVGYAAIAKGLKIFQGNAFMPKEYVKRNVAAQILYNLISN